jgi:GNAT superfamily N-acetyltransferase
MEAELLENWLRARSIARGLPQPVADHGGLRVDTNLPGERRRYVFAGPAQGISDLARSINETDVVIKMCGPGPLLLSLLTPRWHLHPGGFLMTRDAGLSPAPSLPLGYRLQLLTEFPLTTARIFADDDTLAASGYAVEYENVFVYDRISTHPAHQHQGLGAAVMAALGTAQRSQAAQRVLVATEAGRRLYATLGWNLRSHYATVALTPPF